MSAQPRKQQLSPATLLILDFAEARGILDKKEKTAKGDEKDGRA